MTGAVPRGRILIAASSYAEAKAMLDLAGRLAAAHRGDFHGIFFEHSLVADLPEGPGRTMVTHAGDLVAAPEPVRLRAVLARELATFEQALGAMAKLHRRRWAMERRQGELISDILDAVGDRDLFILGSARARPTLRVSRLLVLPGEEDPASAREVARALSTDRETDVQTLALARSDAAPEADMVFDSPDRLQDWIARTPAAAVVADMTARGLRGRGTLRGLIERAFCPIVLLGPGSGGDQERPAAPPADPS